MPTLLRSVLTRPVQAGPTEPVGILRGALTGAALSWPWRWSSSSSSSSSRAGPQAVDELAGASLGDGVVKLDCGCDLTDGHGSAASLRRSARRQVGRSAEARDHGRGSEPITMIVVSVGRGAVALVAIGDGADAERAHGAGCSSGEAELRHDGGGRTRGRTIAIVIAMVMVIGTGGSAGSRWARRCSGRRGGVKRGRGQALADKAARSASLSRGERPSTVRSTEADAMPKLGRKRERARRFERERRRRGCAKPRCARRARRKRGAPILAEARTGADG